VPEETNGATGLYTVDRLSALSDGIFAIVLTLLVLDLKPPEPPVPGTDLAGWLVTNGPDFLAWAVSFVVVARLWMVHHHVLARLDTIGAGTAVANLAFLGAVSLVPFGASLVGSYEFDEPGAVAVFSATLGLSGFLLGLLARHAGTEPGWTGRHHLVVVPVLAAGAGLVSQVHPLAGLVV
jgi:uncharacterized membrane protein